MQHTRQRIGQQSTPKRTATPTPHRTYQVPKQTYRAPQTSGARPATPGAAGQFGRGYVTRCAVRRAVRVTRLLPGGRSGKKQKPRNRCNSAAFRVGLTGFEPATSCSQSRRATKLRYSPSCQTTQATIIPKAKTNATGMIIPRMIAPAAIPHGAMEYNGMNKVRYHGHYD